MKIHYFYIDNDGIILVKYWYLFSEELDRIKRCEGYVETIQPRREENLIAKQADS